MRKNDKYNLIMSREQRVAGRVAAKVLERPEVSVWMFLFPMAFIPFMQRYQVFKEKAEVVRQGYLFTKKTALEAAWRIHRGELAPVQALAQARSKVWRNPGASGMILEIYQRQMVEIELLVGHYLALLGAEGDSWPALVRSAYGSYARYGEFLAELTRAEGAVNAVAGYAVKGATAAVPEVIARIEQALATVRAEEARGEFL